MDIDTSRSSKVNRWPVYGWAGLAMAAAAWVLNWSLDGLRTHLLFFPLWLGYSLTVDALVYLRKGTSLLKRSAWNYAGLFIVSAPAWWLFELFNLRTQNWFYDGRQYFTDLQYFLLASLSFSTVMPAVFGTAELAGTFGWTKKIEARFLITPRHSTLMKFFITGCLMLVLVLAWPLLFFPLVWLAVVFILEPLNFWMGHRTILEYTAKGDSRPVVALWIGVIICAFFWEMWNFYSYPKWVYHVPYVGFLKVFEMPILGYSGYIPFSLELFALYHFAAGLLRPKVKADYIRISH